MPNRSLLNCMRPSRVVADAAGENWLQIARAVEQCCICCDWRCRGGKGLVAVRHRRQGDLGQMSLADFQAG